jgi:hypothetical protein
MCLARKFSKIMGGDFVIIVNQFSRVSCPLCKMGRLTTLRVSSEAENREPQLQNKRGNIVYDEVKAI